MTLPEAIEIKRSEKKITIRTISFAADITQNSYSDFKKNNRNIGYKTLFKLCKAVDINVLNIEDYDDN